MATENIKFKIELFATYWDKKPICEILINNESHYVGEISGSINNPTIIEFTHNCEHDKDYKFTIHRQGKDLSQTIVEDGKIVKDQMLHIKALEIDEIDMGALVYEGEYKPEYPQPWASEQTDLPPTLKNVTVMGHNGTWTLSFKSPFYMWLLEHLY